MIQTCNFDQQPPVVFHCAPARGRSVVWLNLDATPLAESSDTLSDPAAKWQAVSERLPLPQWNLDTLMAAATPQLWLSASAGDIAAIAADLPDADPSDVWRRIRSAQVEAYDTSEAVNSFILGGRRLWLDKATRVGLANSLAIEAEAGRTDTTLWLDSLCLTLPVADARRMLAALELYALECYNVTAAHLAAVASATPAALADFDPAAGYPAPPVLD